MVFKSPRAFPGFFVCGRDHLRVVRAGLVIGAIGGCDYRDCGRGGARPSQLLLPKILVPVCHLVGPRGRCADPSGRRRSFCGAASQRGRVHREF